MTESAWLLLPSGQRAAGDFIDDTLVLRAREKGLDHRLTSLGEFPRQRVEVIRGPDLEARINELYYRRGWTDGLPIVAPTLERVNAALQTLSLPRDATLGELDPLKGIASVEKVAANAVMAGCEPKHLPVVIAAVRAIASPAFNLRGVQTTDENVTPLLILSGPDCETLEVNASFGALGPGWRGNAAIGRALRLVMHNIGGGWPAAVSFAGLGQPGRYSLCLAENERDSPWPPLRLEHGYTLDDNVLTVMRAECVINVTGGLAELASVMGSAASAFSIAHGGKVAVCIAPYTARSLRAEGMDKAAVKRWLHEHGRIPAAELEDLWIRRKAVEVTRWPSWVSEALESAGDGEALVPIVATPEDIVVFVAGGDVPIAQQAYFPTWGFPDCCISERIAVARNR
ncbi:MAG: hypothetical protein KDK91_08735 [Gammaproteobacteria bacterium]|nr:hypothetical protein [Gammaproteobacteria bacterium]